MCYTSAMTTWADPSKKKYYESEKGRAAYARANKRYQQRRDECKRAAASLLGGVCQVCGYDHVGALQFHHRDPAEKVNEIGNMIQRHPNIYSVEDILIELSKCDLLCSNCHDVYHWEAARV